MKRMSADEAAEIIQPTDGGRSADSRPPVRLKRCPRPSLAALMNYIGRRSLFRSAC